MLSVIPSSMAATKAPPERRRVAVGTTVARRPPHRPVLALLTHTVPTLEIGTPGPFWVRTHSRRTGVAESVWHGVQHRPSARESPWPTAFPPCAPPTVPRPCSRTSQVLCSRSTPRRRTWRTYGSSPSPPGPLTICGRQRGLPVLAHEVSLHAWGLRLRGAAPCSRFRNSALLPSVLPDAVGSPKRKISELNTQPADTSVQRFKCDVAAALTWLGARVVRYTFPVRLFHSLLHAGLSRRYPGNLACSRLSRRLDPQKSGSAGRIACPADIIVLNPTKPSSSVQEFLQ